ncbi:tRNA (adenosine(37)-N6)-threonylcarbamoyltransferase complex dimerization subunit type 1 TsaB [Leptobacterium sp. I13]|uniref:tRNA (adenosine(37)-N6)-threonylcarbamoyltransferase complex dimerization subunit type 1 TsaB n=1 Tax=Leptobacterium meishanense TaxID=3128904 RepID=UPI0030EE90E2
MAVILNLETSSTNCSVSISEKGQIIVLKEEDTVGYSHSENLHKFIKEALTEASLSFNHLDAIAVSKGPGSYTGLRIGVSAAKGLCFALDKPLIAVSTLKALSMQLQIDKGFIVPMLDARRMEVYAAVFDAGHKKVRETKAEIIEEASFHKFLNQDKVYFIGSGAEKCKPLIQHPNAMFTDEKFVPSAKEMATLAFQKYQKGDFEDVAYFEPYYLKDFIPGSKL